VQSHKYKWEINTSLRQEQAKISLIDTIYLTIRINGTDLMNLEDPEHPKSKIHIFFFHIGSKTVFKKARELGTVAHAYNPTFLGPRDRRIRV
jgi:hypothetical protein